MKFTDFPLDPNLQDGIASLGFEDATPIQEHAIPVILEGHDLIACAQTGTGKTGAYLIPLIHMIRQMEPGKVRALVVAPTRELAQQIDQQVEAISYFAGVSSIAVYGGKEKGSWDRQKSAIVRGVDIIIATPGRLNMHTSLGYLDFSELKAVVLDEADKMLDMGFYGDILRIFSKLPADRQNLLFSATMPKDIRKLAREIMKDPKEISFKVSKPAEGVDQRAYICYDRQKIPLIQEILKEKNVDNVIVFASRKTSVNDIYRELKRLKYDVGAIHSDKTQDERNDTLRGFKNKELRILVATDIVSRGIDIDNLSMVLNFDAPHDGEDYVHRIGRTARAANKGIAVTFVNPTDQRRFSKIERMIETEVPKHPIPPELGDAPEYNPNKSGGGGRGNYNRRGGGGNRNHRGGNRHGGGGRGRNNDRNRNRNKSNSNQGDKKENRQNNSGSDGNSQNGPKPDNKNRNRRRNHRRGRPGDKTGNDQSNTPPKE